MEKETKRGAGGVRGEHCGLVDGILILGVKPDSNRQVCKNCPFRKDKPFWMYAFAKAMNLARLRAGMVQHCHESYELDRKTLKGVPVVCGGANRCLQGGDELVFSIAELEQQEPADPSYYEVVFTGSRKACRKNIE